MLFLIPEMLLNTEKETRLGRTAKDNPDIEIRGYRRSFEIRASGICAFSKLL